MKDERADLKHIEATTGQVSKKSPVECFSSSSSRFCRLKPSFFQFLPPIKLHSFYLQIVVDYLLRIYRVQYFALFLALTLPTRYFLI